MKSSVVDQIYGIQSSKGHEIKELQKGSAKKEVVVQEESGYDPFFPKYISKRDKIGLYMKGPVVVPTAGEMHSPVSERKLVE